MQRGMRSALAATEPLGLRTCGDDARRPRGARRMTHGAWAKRDLRAASVKNSVAAGSAPHSAPTVSSRSGGAARRNGGRRLPCRRSTTLRHARDQWYGGPVRHARTRSHCSRLADVDAGGRARCRSAVRRLSAGGSLHADVGSGAPVARAGQPPGDDVAGARLCPGALRERPLSRALAALSPGDRVIQAEWLRPGRLQQPLRGHRRDRAPYGPPRRLRALHLAVRA